LTKKKQLQKYHKQTSNVLNRSVNAEISLTATMFSIIRVGLLQYLIQMNKP